MGSGGELLTDVNQITLTTGPKPPLRASRRQQLQSARADADRIRGTGQVGGVSQDCKVD